MAENGGGNLAVNPMSLRVAFTITTHNRKSELERTLGELSRLDPAPDEIIVCADGCTDDSVPWIRQHCPQVRLLVHDQARGSIPSRNELIREAGGEIIVSLDDDSYPLASDFVRSVRELFEAHPRLAVAGFAQRSDEFPGSLSTADFGREQFTGSFANSSAAIRRQAFLELGGYPDFFFHAYEEPDFALRCLNVGWQVRYEPSPLIRHHFTSLKRNEVRVHHRHARNELWSVLMRCPAWALIAVASFRILRQATYALRRGPKWLLQEPVWWWEAARGIGQTLRARSPIPWSKYLAWMRLVRRPVDTELEWNALLRGERL